MSLSHILWIGRDKICISWCMYFLRLYNYLRMFVLQYFIYWMKSHVFNAWLIFVILLKNNMNTYNFYSKFAKNRVFKPCCRNYKQKVQNIYILNVYKIIYIHIYILINFWYRQHVISLNLSRMWKLNTQQKVESHILIIRCC